MKTSRKRSSRKHSSGKRVNKSSRKTSNKKAQGKKRLKGLFKFDQSLTDLVSFIFENYRTNDVGLEMSAFVPIRNVEQLLSIFDSNLGTKEGKIEITFWMSRTDDPDLDYKLADLIENFLNVDYRSVEIVGSDKRDEINVKQKFDSPRDKIYEFLRNNYVDIILIDVERLKIDRF